MRTSVFRYFFTHFLWPVIAQLFSSLTKSVDFQITKIPIHTNIYDSACRGIFQILLICSLLWNQLLAIVMYVVSRWKSRKTTCGFAPTVAFIRNCVQPLVKSQLVFIVHKTHPYQIRLMWVWAPHLPLGRVACVCLRWNRWVRRCYFVCNPSWGVPVTISFARVCHVHVRFVHKFNKISDTSMFADLFEIHTTAYLYQ